MFNMRFDWCSILIGSSILTTSCCLAVMSLKLDSSGIFAVLYMVLGITGSLFIVLLRQQNIDEAENVPLNTLKCNMKRNSEKSVIKCKISAAEILNTSRNMTERKHDEDKTSINTDFDLVLDEDNTEVFKADNITKESSTSNLEEDDNNSKNPIRYNIRDSANILPLITVEDIEYDFELPEPDMRSNWDNNQILLYNIGNHYEDFPTIDNCEKVNRYEDNKLVSYKFSVDNVAIPPVKSQLYPKKSVSDSNLNQFYHNKSLLERKLSSEPTCFSSLCGNLFPQPVQSNMLQVPQQTFLKKAHW